MARGRASTPQPAPLTPKQLALFAYIRDYLRRNGFVPTMQELGEAFGVSKVTIYEHITALEKKGYLKRSRHKARSLRLNDAVSLPNERPTRLPLAGTIAAGKPIEAIEQAETLDLEELFASPHESFVLKVKGDSMIDEQIRDGDYVVVQKRETARNGELVVALLDNGEATLKRFYRDRDGVRLEAANPAYKPIIAKNVRIQGVVVGVLRRY
jgi:repressor LexA